MEFTRTSRVLAPRETLYAWHMRPGAFERLAPPWQDVRVVDHRGGPNEPGSIVELSVPIGPLRTRWIAEHTNVVPGHMFQDVQTRGPFKNWVHTHRFLGNGSTSTLVDEIHYELPFGALGALGRGRIATDLERIFGYRHRTTVSDLETHGLYRERPRMRVLLTGASGLLGTALEAFLSSGGHTVIPLRRSTKDRQSGDTWDPESSFIDPKVLDGVDGIVHLAGENVGSRRFRRSQKRRILESRVVGTKLLSEMLARMSNKPRVLVSASAIGIYGDRGEEILDEASPIDTGGSFLANVCREWERATEPAEHALRVVRLRTGVVLSPRGGALARMLPPFRVGLGGIIGTGTQFMSFIPIDEFLAVVLHALMNDTVVGPVNAVSPTPVTNREFTETLARTLRRPAFVPFPRTAARVLLGEMADELLLSSARVLPARLLETNYRFLYPELGLSLRHLLGCARE